MTTTFDPNTALALADQQQIAGNLGEAIRLYTSLLDRSPGFWPAYANCGLAHAVAGNQPTARTNFRRALVLEPSAAVALRNLADSLESEEPAAALIVARAAVAMAPETGGSWLSLGGIELALHRHALAASALRRSLVLEPGVAEAAMGLGRALRDKGLSWLRRAVAVTPTLPTLRSLAHHLTLHENGEEPDTKSTAGRLLRRALALAPGDIEAVVELTAIIDGYRASEELHRWALRALPFTPDPTVLRNNMATASLGLGCLEEAERVLAAAIARRPDYAEAHFNRATPLFLLGRDDEAWSEYEWRWRVERFEKAPSSAPRWSGEDLGGRRLMVHEEQGLGDTLQFVRYLPVLAEKHRDTVFLCHPRLERLLGGSFPDLAIEAKPAVPAHDLAVGLLSLPKLLGGPIPPPPYLKIPRVHHVDAQGRLKVGLAWSGNPAHVRNQDRSIPLALLESWLGIPGTAWFSIQFGPQTRDIARAGFAERIADLGSHVPDLQDTAGALAGLDLLISVDTAFCHLAGSLGLPVWTLLPWLPDWRWGMAGTTTAWYPSMRLYRQPSRGDWQSVIAEVGEALRLRALQGPAEPNI